MSDRYVGAMAGLVWGAGFFGGALFTHLDGFPALAVWAGSTALAIGIAISLIVLSDRAP